MSTNSKMSAACIVLLYSVFLGLPSHIRMTIRSQQLSNDDWLLYRQKQLNRQTADGRSPKTVDNHYASSSYEPVAVVNREALSPYQGGSPQQGQFPSLAYAGYYIPSNSVASQLVEVYNYNGPLAQGSFDDMFERQFFDRLTRPNSLYPGTGLPNRPSASSGVPPQRDIPYSPPDLSYGPRRPYDPSQSPYKPPIGLPYKPPPGHPYTPSPGPPYKQHQGPYEPPRVLYNLPQVPLYRPPYVPPRKLPPYKPPQRPEIKQPHVPPYKPQPYPPPYPTGRPPYPTGRPAYPTGRPAYPTGRPRYPTDRPPYRPPRRPDDRRSHDEEYNRYKEYFIRRYGTNISG